MTPEIDISDAAAALGLDYVPEIRPTNERESGSTAYFHNLRQTLHVSPRLLDPDSPVTKALRESVLEPYEPGIKDMSHEDLVRWVVAHELGHAQQLASYPTRRDYIDAYRKSLARVNSHRSYRESKFEHDADDIAWHTYHLVRIANDQDLTDLA